MFREACAIGLVDRVILTGGEYTMATVAVYNMDGFTQELRDGFIGYL